MSDPSYGCTAMRFLRGLNFFALAWCVCVCVCVCARARVSVAERGELGTECVGATVPCLFIKLGFASVQFHKIRF